MKGLELSRLYYEKVGRPAIEGSFPELMPRIAAGLVGQGSDCYGWDDEISRDHDFGPGFCVWLSGGDYETYGERLQALYDSLPKSFSGVPARIESARAGKRVGVMSVRDFYSQFIGSEQPPGLNMRWMLMKDEFLSAATNGEVFSDGKGDFSLIRESLLNYYPEDVRVKKIAACAGKMAQAGQYNYPRCMRRKRVVAADFAQSEFLEYTLRMAYLLNRRYMPYYKWSHYGMQFFTVLTELKEMTKSLVLLGPYEAEEKQAVIEKICAMVLDELKAQDLTEGSEDFLEAHIGRIMSRIRDPQIRSLHVLQY